MKKLLKLKQLLEILEFFVSLFINLIEKIKEEFFVNLLEILNRLEFFINL